MLFEHNNKSEPKFLTLNGRKQSTDRDLSQVSGRKKMGRSFMLDWRIKQLVLTMLESRLSCRNTYSETFPRDST